MATTTAELVSYENPGAITERVAITGFLAAYTGNTRVSDTSDLRLFADWCQHNQLKLFGVRRLHLELFARWMEGESRMPSTGARRLSTLASLYRYCHADGVVPRDPFAAAHAERQIGATPRW